MTSLDTLVQKYQKKHPGILVKGSELKNRTFERVPSGSLSFDLMLGGGWPLNQWNEIVGNESSGKTVVALKTIAANQAINPDHQTLWVAAEDMVPDWAEKLGVDLDRVVIVETNVAEDALQAIIDFQDERAVDAVVIDSLPALVPTGENEKDMEAWSPGLAARLNNQFFRKSGKTMKRSLTEEDRPTLNLVINQWREKIGVMYGDPRTTPGGKGKDFAYFTRVELSRDEWIKDGDERIGIAIKARCTKNKTAPPYQGAQVDFYFSDSAPFHAGDYDTQKELILIAMAYDIVERKGAYYYFNGEQLGQGKDEAFLAIREDVGLAKTIESDVRKVVLHDGE